MTSGHRATAHDPDRKTLPPNTGEITALTGLRGVAAFIIMAYHFGQPAQSLDVDTHFTISNGYLAVDFFYVLSGFVLAYAYGTSLSHALTLRKYGQFILKRVARLYPAYIVVVGLFVAKMTLNFAGENPLSNYRTFDIIGNLLMMTGWGLQVTPFVGDSWSVSAELLCYLVFPLILPVAVPGRLVWRVIAFVAVFCGLIAVGVLGHGSKGPLDVVVQDSFYPLLRCLCGFVLGLLTYRAWLGPATRRFFSLDGTCLVILLVFVTLAMLGAQDWILYVCIAPAVLALAADSAVGRTLFGNRPIVFVGEISYSLYLVHGLFVSTSVRMAHLLQIRFGMHAFYFLTAPAGMLAAISLAWLSYRCIEIPGRKLLMRVFGPADKVDAEKFARAVRP